MEPVLLTIASALLGALFSIAVWMLKDVRTTVRATSNELKDFRLEAATTFVRRVEFDEYRKGVDAKLSHLDERLGLQERTIDRLEARGGGA